MCGVKGEGKGGVRASDAPMFIRWVAPKGPTARATGTRVRTSPGRAPRAAAAATAAASSGNLKRPCGNG